MVEVGVSLVDLLFIVKFLEGGSSGCGDALSSVVLVVAVEELAVDEYRRCSTTVEGSGGGWE